MILTNILPYLQNFHLTDFCDLTEPWVIIFTSWYIRKLRLNLFHHLFMIIILICQINNINMNCLWFKDGIHGFFCKERNSISWVLQNTWIFAKTTLQSFEEEKHNTKLNTLTAVKKCNCCSGESGFQFVDLLCQTLPDIVSPTLVLFHTCK